MKHFSLQIFLREIILSRFSIFFLYNFTFSLTARCSHWGKKDGRSRSTRRLSKPPRARTLPGGWATGAGRYCMQPMQPLPHAQCSPSPDAFCPQSPKENFSRCIHYSAWIQHTERALYLIHCGNEIHHYYHYHHSLHCSLCTRKSGCFGSKCTCFVPGSYRRVLWRRQWEMQGKPLPEYFIFWLTYVYKEKKKIAVLFRPAPVWIRSYL